MLMVEVIDKVGNIVMKIIDFVVDIMLLVLVIVLNSVDDIGVQGDNMMNCI